MVAALATPTSAIVAKDIKAKTRVDRNNSPKSMFITASTKFDLMPKQSKARSKINNSINIED